MIFLNKDSFIACEDVIAICGKYIANDSIHVGIAIKEDENKIIHFQNGTHIPYDNIDKEVFDSYFFNPIKNFNQDLIPSLAALCDLISGNPGINQLQFNRNNIVYDGGKFNIINGAFQINNVIENIVNCGVFVTALLKTYDYDLLDWNTWPNTIIDNIPTYLESWLDISVSEQDKAKFYNTSKEIRGKHIIVCPFTEAKPSIFEDVIPLSTSLIERLNS